ncbi:MAG: hypothetical protein ACI81T_002556, partial [Bacteroidia bacterium]
LYRTPSSTLQTKPLNFKSLERELGNHLIHKADFLLWQLGSLLAFKIECGGKLFKSFV